MNKTIHRAETRGHANHGWLDTHHTFSFAGYYDPRRVHFGALRVLNDDTVAPGEGFGTHPHDNMEIVSIALEGALRHGDSMGNMQVLRPGEIQVMSAGTGITHSEMNASATEPVKFLQIWVLTDAQGHTPRYNQLELAPARRNELRTIVAPEGRGDEHVGWIHQDAWFSTLDLDKDHTVEYRMKTPGHGAYVFVIEGNVKLADEELGPRDGVGITDTDGFLIKGDTDARVLIIEVPMR
ncbi:pirin family protein [uncultured Alistipes sp.]|jgi:redox-sensitive bicupin YhaK (pirin superfamily)|uniref:pirin family protein n=1 Tax=Alistipes sp. TaxID=1872444 RepID=UPI0025F3B13D|nr:pirin family protein [uncultured Alistipes sp.]